MMIDTHLHLFDPQRHAFADDASYRPQGNECANWSFLEQLLDAHGVGRAVLVAPTAGYNHDLRPLAGFLAQAGQRLVGVARLRGDEDVAELRALADSGVRGVRLDLRADSAGFVSDLQQQGIVGRWAALGWFVQVQADAVVWAEVATLLAQWPTDLVIDHCGLPDPTAGVQQPGFAAVCALAQRAGTWIKLSGPFRFSRESWPYADTDVYAQQLLRQYGPERCVWGSDWPFVRTAQRLDYGAVLAHLARWVPDADARRMILNDSAARLLGLAVR
jgi:predicted TIM-barrel fold metal-dependent hydrolase